MPIVSFLFPLLTGGGCGFLTDAIPFFVEAAKQGLGLLILIVEGDRSISIARDFGRAHLLGDFVESLFCPRDVRFDQIRRSRAGFPFLNDFDTWLFRSRRWL